MTLPSSPFQCIRVPASSGQSHILLWGPDWKTGAKVVVDHLVWQQGQRNVPKGDISSTQLPEQDAKSIPAHTGQGRGKNHLGSDQSS